jgi:PAS domain S-box-containing protein
MTSDQQPSKPSHNLYQRLDINFALRAAGLGVWELDGATGQITWDDHCRSLFGFTHTNQLTYEEVIHCIHEEDVSRVDQAVQAMLTQPSESNYDQTYRIIRADDNTLRWIHSQGKAYFTPTGELVRFIGISQDVTEQQLAQQVSAQSEARYRQLVEDLENKVYQRTRELEAANEELLTINEEQLLTQQQLQETIDQMRSMVESAPFPIGVYIGRNMQIRFANQNIIAIFGKGPDVINKSYIELLPELADQQIFKQLLGVYNTGIPFASGTQRVNIEHDGSLVPYYFNYNFTPLFDRNGQVYGVMNTAADVTELELARQALEESEARYRLLSTHLEEQVQQRTEELAAANEELAASNEELEANIEEYAAINEELEEANSLLTRSNDNLQTFAYVASHDLQEPLRKIQQFGDLLKTRFAGSVSGEELVYLERMQVAASRMSTLIKDLLSFSRISPQPQREKLVSLNSVVGSVLNVLDMAIEELQAQVQVDNLPTVLGDASQLEQLFQNLISNALKFHQPNVAPRIHISSQTLGTGELPPSIKFARRTSHYHRIEVTDNGIGFDEKYLDRIFQVFQRLHGRSEFAGTGIGLAICEKVASNHGGVITARSQIGQGATFMIYLPVDEV